MAEWDVVKEAPAGSRNPWDVESEKPISGLSVVSQPPTGYVPEEQASGFVSGALVDPILGTVQTAAGLTRGVGSVLGFQGIETPEINKREAELAKASPDFRAGRAEGNLLSPFNLLPSKAMGQGATMVGRVMRGMAAGGIGAAMQPTAEGDLGTKTVQTGLGMAVGFALGAAGETLSRGTQALGEWMAREKPEVITDKAVQSVLKRINQGTKSGGPTAVQAMDLVNTANRAGKPMTLVDVTGKDVEGLAGSISRQPGTKGMFEDFLTQRDQGAANRLKSDIAEFVHGGPTMFETTEALLAARSAAGKPDYEAMERLEGIWSPRLQEFLDSPEVKQGMSLGYKIERLHALAQGRKFDPTQLGVDLDAEGNLKLLKVPNMRVLDFGKKGLDEMISQNRDKVTGRLTSLGYGLNEVRKEYVRLIDELDTQGIYKAARDAWGGKSKSLDALRMGRSVFEGSPEETAAEFKQLSESDKEFYRIGVADKLREKLGKAGLGDNVNEAKALLRNPWSKEHLSHVMRSNEEYEKFVDAVAQETTMFNKMTRVLRGSQTQERAVEDTMMADVMKSAGEKVASATLGPAYKYGKGVFDVVRALGDKKSPEVSEKMAKILLTTDFNDASEFRALLAGEVERPKIPFKRSAEAFLKASRGSPGVSALVGGQLGRSTDAR